MYHVIDSSDRFPPDIGRIVPRAMIDAAGGMKNFLTIPLSSEVKLHRRRDFERVRKPVDGKRGHKTGKFHTRKDPARRVIMNESFVGERWRNAWFEVDPSIRRHLDQRFIVEVNDAEGGCWAVPDSFLEGIDGTFAICEGKTALVWEHLPNGTKRLKRGLPDKTQNALIRIQDALGRAGVVYEVFDQAWSAHPIHVANIRAVLSATKKLPFGSSERLAMERLLACGDLTVGECAREFAGRSDCPEEWVCAAMGNGVLEIDFERPIDRDSRVSPPKPPFWSKG
ncbi:hypothetical protein WN73_37685 [Bradyrhizobium sp. CCBAU 45394]|uniref:hypothetical protein n=1 Tax=Bradyrhizobium sp. CCBAU 45394 TaxID=1325087 RepID=UPI0023027538|nr:hypothetical protein [Bradyrhizobium sp. CCBAU 45394]MDA9396253.1 hypothetical protein [Bradyrhizobium sp. CCBAU 45394]